MSATTDFPSGLSTWPSTTSTQTTSASDLSETPREAFADGRGHVWWTAGNLTQVLRADSLFTSRCPSESSHWGRALMIGPGSATLKLETWDYFEIHLGAISIIDPDIDPSNVTIIEFLLAAGVDVTVDYVRSDVGSDFTTTQLTTWVAPAITPYASPPSRHTSPFPTASTTDFSFSASTTASTTMESQVPSFRGCSLMITRADLGLVPNDYVNNITITSRAATLPVLLFNATLFSDTVSYGSSWSSGSSSGGPAFSPAAIAVPMSIAAALLTAGAVFYRHRNKRKRRLRQGHTTGLEGTPNYAQMREDASSMSLPASSLNLRLFGPNGWLGRFAPARHGQQQQQPLTPIVHSPAMSPEEPRGNPFIAGGFSFGEGVAGVADGMGRRPSMATSYQASEFLRHSSHAPSETDYSSNAHTHHTRTSSTYPSVSAHHTGSSFQSHDAPRLNPYPYPNPLRMQHTGSTGMGTKVESDLLSMTMRDSVDGHGTRNSGELEMRKMKNPFGDEESIGGRRTETDSYSSHASWSTAGRRR